MHGYSPITLVVTFLLKKRYARDLYTKKLSKSYKNVSQNTLSEKLFKYCRKIYVHLKFVSNFSLLHVKFWWRDKSDPFYNFYTVCLSQLFKQHHCKFMLVSSCKEKVAWNSNDSRQRIIWTDFLYEYVFCKRIRQYLWEKYENQ